MSTPEQEALEARRKRTIWLVAGGAASLLLPLLGALYIWMSESRSPRGPDPSAVFDRREVGEAKITIAPLGEPGAKAAVQAPAETRPDSSLSFVKGNGDFIPNKTAEEPEKSTPEEAAEPAPAPPQTPVKKNAKKPFVMPKLQGVKNFNTLKGNTLNRVGGQSN